MLDEGTITRIAVVAEDRRNPCIEEIERFAERIGIPYRYQSGQLAEDVAFLLNANHVVFGYGTFGLGICLLSTAIQTVHTYEMNGYQDIPGLQYVSVSRDMTGNYFQEEGWKGSKEQLQWMIDYPEAGLNHSVFRKEHS